MPYEATVPVHRRLLWPAVIDPERLLGALPNAVVDASGNQGVAGRLRVRMRDQTVTFRGIARIIEVIPKSLRVTLEVEATFGRAGGAVEGVVEITLRAAGSGTRAVVGGNLRLTDDSSPLPPGPAVDAALGRIVRRWFAALAESSPAAPATPRAVERASLAVVRTDDGDVDSSETEDSEGIGARNNGAVENGAADKGSLSNGSGADESGSERGGTVQHGTVQNSTAQNNTAQNGNLQNGAAQADPAQADTAQASTAQNSAAHAEPARAETSDAESAAPRDEFEQGESRWAESAAARAGGPQVQLRLVSSRESVAPDEEEPAAVRGTAPGAHWGQAQRHGEEPEPPAPTAGFEPAADANLDAGEDIWSRLRDRGMPRWIPVVVSAVLAAFATAVLFVVALRRRHHRHED